ncbi:MAG: flagellar basal body-associated FliL family protein [Betaproteobacteria bacterium]|nr:flagellar basal body-associated FliL family protein [Betaproteobacteria bacterium]
MAEKTEAGAPKPQRNTMKIVIIGVVALVLVAVLGVGGFMLLGNHGDADDEAAVEQPAPKKKKKTIRAAPVYVVLDPFTVNLKPEDGDHYLQLAISVEVDDTADGERVKLFMPKLRNEIMLLLSDKLPSKLATKEGKEALAIEIRTHMNAVLEPGGKRGDIPVSEVLFTSFIVQ